MPELKVERGGGGGAAVHEEVALSQQSETFENLDPINSQVSLGGMSQDVDVPMRQDSPSAAGGAHGGGESQGFSHPGGDEDVAIEEEEALKDASALLLALGAVAKPPSARGRGRGRPRNGGAQTPPFDNDDAPHPRKKRKETPRLKTSAAHNPPHVMYSPAGAPGSAMGVPADRTFKAKLCESIRSAPKQVDVRLKDPEKDPKAKPPPPAPQGQSRASLPTGIVGGKNTAHMVQKSGQVRDETDDKELDDEERRVKEMYKAIGHNVEFADLMIQTSNIKVSFSFENCAAVTIDQLCAHLHKDQRLTTQHYNVRVKDKSAASNGEGRTFFGGVLTITMDAWGADQAEDKMHNTSVRLFGFKETDPERRHKAQFNGCTCKHVEILRFFSEVFGAHHKMNDIRVEPNSVFSATDNAVMDPQFGIEMEGLVACLESSNLVDHFKEQVTGGVNFTFRTSPGGDGRTCKPTVQKSGSIQLMLVDQPRRIRLETMRFLITHCKDAFVPLSRLNLTKRTIDKRTKARSALLERKAAAPPTPPKPTPAPDSYAAAALALPPAPRYVVPLPAGPAAPDKAEGPSKETVSGIVPPSPPLPAKPPPEMGLRGGLAPPGGVTAASVLLAGGPAPPPFPESPGAVAKKEGSVLKGLIESTTSGVFGMGQGAGQEPPARPWAKGCGGGGAAGGLVAGVAQEADEGGGGVGMAGAGLGGGGGIKGGGGGQEGGPGGAGAGGGAAKGSVKEEELEQAVAVAAAIVTGAEQRGGGAGDGGSGGA